MELLLDVWEGSLDIDETVIKNEGKVAGVIIRINDMSGGHHIDENFINQWNQSANFDVRSIYFVYNPWVSGKDNYNYLRSILPSDCSRRIFPDIEVRYTGYSPVTYANEVDYFSKAIEDWGKTYSIYTGGWFLSYLAYWPKSSYWWARYPYTLYPPGRENWSWEKLWNTVNNMGYYPDPDKKCPGLVELWQASGDRLIMPGCANRAIDINVWSGTKEALVSWINGTQPPSVEMELRKQIETLQNKLNAIKSIVNG